jgi:hypothetical protein
MAVRRMAAGTLTILSRTSESGASSGGREPVGLGKVSQAFGRLKGLPNHSDWDE